MGYNLIDHTAPGALTIIVNSTSLTLQNILDTNVLEDYFENLQGPITSAGGIEGIAFIETNKSYDSNGYPDLELLHIGSSLNSDIVFRENFNIRNEIYDEVFEGLRRNNTDTFMVFPMVMRPKSRGRIKLRSSNPFDAPAIFPNYFQDPYDIEISIRGIRKLIELLNTNAMKSIDARLLKIPVPGCKYLKYNSDEYWECYTRHFTFTIYHYVGTAKMGRKTDRMGELKL